MSENQNGIPGRLSGTRTLKASLEKGLPESTIRQLLEEVIARLSESQSLVTEEDRETWNGIIQSLEEANRLVSDEDRENWDNIIKTLEDAKKLVSEEDRRNWDDKVRCYVNPNNPRNLVFTTE